MQNKIIPILVCFIITSSATYCQSIIYASDTVVIGKVIAQRNALQIGLKSKIVLVGTDGSSLEKITDDTGAFYFSHNEVKPGISYVITSHPFPKPLLPYFGARTGKISMVNVSEKDLPITYNFISDPSGCRLGFPGIYFEDNSFELSSISKEAIMSIVETLNDNPTLVVEIGGKALSRETSPETLAMKRAEVIKLNIVENGIDEGRIVAAGYTDTLYHVVDWYDKYFELGDSITPTFIENLVDPAQIETAELWGKRTELKVIRSDYIPK